MPSFPALSDRRIGPELSGRGYHVVYRDQEVNHCPGCGRTHWIIGRISAECAFCATALPLAETCTRDVHQSVVVRRRNQFATPAWAA